MAAVTAAAGEHLPKSCSSVTFNTFSSQALFLSLCCLLPLTQPALCPDVQGRLTGATQLQGRAERGLRRQLTHLSIVFLYLPRGSKVVLQPWLY